jgi:hypothetical protein
MAIRSLSRRAFAAGVALSAGLAGGVVLASPGYAAQTTSQVYVVHGIPGTPVDVYVNGEKTLDNFQPKDVAGPLELPEGTYDLALTAPGDPLSSAILTVDDAAVPAGANISLAAHLTADGAPTITPFVNDVSPIAAGEARLIVRHTAAAPAVDVRAGGTPVFTNLTNPNEAQADLPAGTVSADVVAAGTSTVVLGPTDLDLAEGAVTIVYAIGSLEDQTLDVVAQTISGLDSAPAGVPGGTGGLADEGSSWWGYAVGAVALLALAGVAARRFALRTVRR